MSSTPWATSTSAQTAHSYSRLRPTCRASCSMPGSGRSRSMAGGSSETSASRDQMPARVESFSCCPPASRTQCRKAISSTGRRPTPCSSSCADSIKTRRTSRRPSHSSSSRRSIRSTVRKPPGRCSFPMHPACRSTCCRSAMARPSTNSRNYWRARAPALPTPMDSACSHQSALPRVSLSSPTQRRDRFSNMLRRRPIR